MSKLDDYINDAHQYIGIIDKIQIEEKKIKMQIEIVSVDNVNCSERILLTTDKEKEFSLGQKVKFTGVLKQAKENTNPKMFNYKKYLLSEKIHYTTYQDSRNIYIYDEEIPFRYNIRTKFKNYVIANFNNLSKDNQSLMVSTILGDSSYLEENQYETYQNIGLLHLLAVSGLHINLLATFMSMTLAYLGVNRKINVVISITLIFIYGYLIGFPPSSVRAIIMFSLSLFASLLHKPYDSLNSLYIAALISLLLNPFWIFSIGFILSYTASFSIIVFFNKVKGLFYPFKGFLIDNLSLILSVNLCLIPLQIFYFNSFNFISILSNLIIVPIASINLIIGFLSLLFSKLTYILNISMDLQNILTDVFQKYTAFNFKFKTPTILDMTFYFLILLIIYNRDILLNLKKEIKKVIFCFIVLSITVYSMDMYRNINDIIVDFIDVGQGDSALLRYRGNNILIDAGGSAFSDFDIGENITLPYLIKSGVNELDALIISHYHDDHYKGSKAIIENLQVDKIISSKYPTEEEFLKIIDKNNIPLYTVNSSNDIFLDDKLYIDILWPIDNNVLDDNENNNSLVCLVNANGFRLLFTGDIEKEVEQQLLRKNIGEVDLLKVAHHGSNTSSHPEFIDELDPKISIISVGENNFYGHPSKQTLQTLLDVNSSIYRTDEMGLISVIIKNDRAIIKPYQGPFYQEDLIKYISIRRNYFLLLIIFVYVSNITVRTYINMEDKLHELQ
jgi:competence protein ComEC